jgi:SAM-dependent methyltransferase
LALVAIVRLVFSGESARHAYDRYASSYDETNAQNDYEMWLGEVLLPELEKHGLCKGWALDVGCGTGRAFTPLLSRGWRIVGCDVSPRMLAEARRKFGTEVSLLNVDGRDLPAICPSLGLSSQQGFHLVLLLNDVVNYMTEDGDLEKAFAGVRRNLSLDQGLAVFDINTIALFRVAFASGVSEEMGARGLRWRGLSHEAKSEAVFKAELSGPGLEPHEHHQRHWTVQQVEEALDASGLACQAIFGQREEDGRILLSDCPDEVQDHKIIFIAGYPPWSTS